MDSFTQALDECLLERSDNGGYNHEQAELLKEVSLYLAESELSMCYITSLAKSFKLQPSDVATVLTDGIVLGLKITEKINGKSS